jgi:hypothetical protein
MAQMISTVSEMPLMATAITEHNQRAFGLGELG